LARYHEGKTKTVEPVRKAFYYTVVNCRSTGSRSRVKYAFSILWL